MPAPLTEREIQSREYAQEADIYFRKDFLTLERPTQQKIVNLLEKMVDLVGKGKQWDAQQFFFTQISQHTLSNRGSYVDRKGVDWREVDDQIKHFCFSDHDMDGYTIVPRRVEQSLTIFRSLMEIPFEREDF